MEPPPKLPMEPPPKPPPPPCPPQPPPPPPPPRACAPVASRDPASKAVANTIIVLRPVMTFSFQRPEPPVIIEPVALAQIWPPGAEWLTGNLEGSNRSSRWHWHQHRKNAGSINAD